MQGSHLPQPRTVIVKSWEDDVVLPLRDRVELIRIILGDGKSSVRNTSGR